MYNNLKLFGELNWLILKKTVKKLIMIVTFAKLSSLVKKLMAWLFKRSGTIKCW